MTVLQLRRYRRAVLAVISVVAVVAVVVTQRHATKMGPTLHLKGPVYEFYAARSGVQCEMAYGGWTHRGWTYCQTTAGAGRSVKLQSTGQYQVCDGQNCLGNPGIGTPTIAAGTTLVLGSFSCFVATNGTKCNTYGDRGFQMTPSGVAQG